MQNSLERTVERFKKKKTNQNFIELVIEEPGDTERLVEGKDIMNVRKERRDVFQPFFSLSEHEDSVRAEIHVKLILRKR